jgi:hypothetical protein
VTEVLGSLGPVVAKDAARARSTPPCHSAAEEYGSPGDDTAGANIAGFVRLADAMLVLGLL